MNRSREIIALPATVELQVFSSAPLGATRNSPPQRGGSKYVNKFRPERAMDYKTTTGFALPFQGDCLDVTITHRVAVGCYALPFQGGRKLAILLYLLVVLWYSQVSLLSVGGFRNFVTIQSCGEQSFSCPVRDKMLVEKQSD
jgi:hypothetical protein